MLVFLTFGTIAVSSAITCSEGFCYSCNSKKVTIVSILHFLAFHLSQPFPLFPLDGTVFQLSYVNVVNLNMESGSKFSISIKRSYIQKPFNSTYTHTSVKLNLLCVIFQIWNQAWAIYFWHSNCGKWYGGYSSGINKSVVRPEGLD